MKKEPAPGGVRTAKEEESMRDDPGRGFIALIVIIAIIYVIWPLDILPDPCYLDDAVVAAGAGAAALGAGK